MYVCMYVHRQFIERRKGRVPAKPLYKVTFGRAINGASICTMYIHDTWPATR